MSFADNADQHRTGFFGVHTPCRELGNAAAKLAHDGKRKLFGFSCDNSKFDSRLKTVGNRVVNFTFDVRFKYGHENGQQPNCKIYFVYVKHEEGRADNDGVDEKEQPCNRARLNFLLHHYGDDVRTARRAANFERKRNGNTDTYAARKCGEDTRAFGEND